MNPKPVTCLVAPNHHQLTLGLCVPNQPDTCVLDPNSVSRVRDTPPRPKSRARGLDSGTGPARGTGKAYRPVNRISLLCKVL